MNLRVVGITVGGREPVVTGMAMSTVVTLEHNDPITRIKIGTLTSLHHGADPLMPQMFRIIKEFEVVSSPDSRTFQANWCDFGFDDHIAAFDSWVRLLDQGKTPGLGDS
jgi:hypothetical protein